MKVLPIFTSAYSFRSILTLDKIEKPDANKPLPVGGPDSIIKICEEEDIKTLFLVEDNMVGFLEAKKNLKKGRELAFGLRLTFCSDITDKSPESEATESKFIIFAKNPAGYFRLTKIFTKANIEGFLNGPRMDFKTLKEFWSDEDLYLVVPFYDSFIFNNTNYICSCVPDFSYIKPVFFLEDNGIFFDELIKENVEKFDKLNQYEKVWVKSIYYKDKKDFLAWQTYKCIKNESTLRVPNLNNCMSDKFSVEGWREANK